jgi:hypothetical protein
MKIETYIVIAFIAFIALLYGKSEIEQLRNLIKKAKR